MLFYKWRMPLFFTLNRKNLNICYMCFSKGDDRNSLFFLVEDKSVLKSISTRINKTHSISDKIRFSILQRRRYVTKNLNFDTCVALFKRGLIKI